MSYTRDFLARKLRDPQAKFLHDLAQEQINNAADTTNKITSNKKGYSLKTRSKTTSKDKYYANIKPLDDSAFYTGHYPDFDNCRLYLFSENSDRLHDYSLMHNKAYAYGTTQVCELYQREDETNITGHEYSSYYNGTHYIVVKDNPRLRLEDIVANEPTKQGFTIVKRFNPLKYGNGVQDSQILAQKTDSSSNKYGYSINMDDKGNIYFYVHYNYRQYFCKLDNAFAISLANANFFFQNFKSLNFKTEKTFIDEAKELLYDLVCQFNFTTKECKISVRGPKEVFLEASSTTALPANLQVHLPLQEGKWSGSPLVPLNQVYDSSPNGHIATIGNPDSIYWQNDNVMLHLFDGIGDTDGADITIPNHSSFNNFTECTIAFWYETAGDITLTNRINMFGYDNTPHIKVHRKDDNDIVFKVTTAADGTGGQSVTSPTKVSNHFVWNFIVCQWKSGEAPRISINGEPFTSASGVVTGSLNSPTRPFTLYDWRKDNASLLNYMFFNRKLADSEVLKLYNFGPHLAQFPTNLEAQRLPDPAPAPVTNPFSTLYDLPKVTSPVLADYTFLNDVSAANPFVVQYNCAVGTPEVIQEELLYDVQDGAGGPGSPFVVIQGPGTTGTTIESSDSSNGIMGDVTSGNVRVAVRIRDVTTGIGLALTGKTLTKAQWDLRRIGTVIGTIYCKIWDATGVEKATLGSIAASSLTDGTYTLQDFVNTSNTFAIPTGTAALQYRIGLEYATGAEGDEIQVRRKSGNLDASVNQDSMDFGSTSWSSNGNDSFEIKCNLFTGLGTTSSDPNVSLSTTTGFDRCVEQFGTGDPLLTKIPTKVILRLKKTGTPTGIGYVRLRNLSGSIDVIMGQIDVSTLATTTTDYTFTNYDNNLAVVSGYQLGFYWTPAGSGSVQVMSNVGTTDPHPPTGTNTNSFMRKYKYTATAGWQDTTAVDLSGKIYIGGNNFTAAKAFSNSITRIYSRSVNTNSSFNGDKITKTIAKARRTGTIPSPSTLKCVIRRQSDNAIMADLGGIDANTIPTGSAWNDIEFVNITSSHVIAANDYVSFELPTCDATNFIELATNKDVVDGSNTVLGQLNGSVYEELAQYDLSGTFYTGGQIDNVSRVRVGQFINTQNSLFINTTNNKETEVTLYLIKVGTPSGTIFVNIRTAEDDSPIKTIGTIPVSGLSATAGTPSTVTVTDVTNSYILKAKDMAISVEYSGGDQNNKVGVMVRANTNYDGDNSYLAKYNGAVYDYEPTKDICAKIRVGGDTYTPEANEPPPVMPQSSTDLFIGVRGDKASMYEKSMHNMFMFTTEILTSQQLDQLYNTRLDIEENSSEEILITNYSFIRDT